MKVLILLTFFLYSFNSLAEIVWLSGGGSYSSFSEVSPKATSDELRHGKSWYAEFDGSDRIPLAAVHYAYRSTSVDNLKIRLENQAPFREDFKLITHEFGGKVILPLPFFDIYTGAGFSFGSANLGNKERSAFGRYWQAGVNLLFNRVLGVKIGYQTNSIITSEFSSLDDKRMKFDQGLFTIGLVMRFGGNGGGIYK
jgi:hypothetical protein